MQEEVSHYPNLTVIEDGAHVVPIRMSNGKDFEMDSAKECVKGVVTRKGLHLSCDTVVLCAGTFLNGVCHIGKFNVPAGRFHVRLKMRLN